MAYQSLYRKYRPQTFADVVGQGHVTRTLQNALESGRASHGYLFTGTRGTAKTTVARLLAKALNCESSDRPVREPCNRCNACVSITAGAAIDVIEMDAASHRGVADMEEVRKAVGFGPMELRYKVFIIDEAHQLSSDAKDAFLKTLEEPPPNVVFILATTEPQSIPITIRSRCQQFDFKRGSMADITGRLKYVLDCEGVSYSPEAVGHVARGAEGSYRDSLSLLEQVLAFAPTAITTADVDTVLGTLDNEMLRRVTDSVSRRDAPSVFALAGELLDAGKEARTLLRTLSLHFRDLLLVSVGGPAVGQELTPEEVGPLQAEARSFSPPEMIRAMEILNEAQGETRWNNQHRLLVELTFLKLMNLGTANPASTFATAPIVFPATRTAPPAASPMASVVPVAPTPVAATVPAAPRPEPAVVAPAPTLPIPQPLLVVKDEEIGSESDETATLTPGYFANDRVGEDDEEEIEPIDTLTGNLFVDEPSVGLSEEISPAGLVGDMAVVPNATAVVAAPTVLPTSTPETVVEEAVPHAAYTIDDVLHVWPEFLRKSGTVSKMTETMMLQSYPSEVRNGVVIISFKSSAAYDKMSEPKGQEFVRKLLRLCLRVEKVSMRFVLVENEQAAQQQAQQKTTTKEKRRERDPIAELDSLDALDHRTRAAEGFGGNGVYEEQSQYMPSPPMPSTYAPPPRPEPRPMPVAAPPTAKAADAPTAAPMRANSVPPVPSQSSNGKPTDGIPAETPPTKMTLSRQAALDDPLVQEVLSTFGGEIMID